MIELVSKSTAQQKFADLSSRYKEVPENSLEALSKLLSAYESNIDLGDSQELTTEQRAEFFHHLSWLRNAILVLQLRQLGEGFFDLENLTTHMIATRASLTMALRNRDRLSPRYGSTINLSNQAEVNYRAAANKTTEAVTAFNLYGKSIVTVFENYARAKIKLITQGQGETLTNITINQSVGTGSFSFEIGYINKRGGSSSLSSAFHISYDPIAKKFVGLENELPGFTDLVNTEVARLNVRK